MGDIEKRVKQRRTREITKRAVLGVFATVGMMSVALVAPNILKVLDSLGINVRLKNWHKQSIARSIDRLLKQGLIEFRDRNGKKFMAITDKGKQRLRLWDLKDFKFDKPKRWDGKWRIIIFDVFEKRREIRNLLRDTLIRIGFQKLQASVWVFPYDCEDLMLLLKADLELGQGMLYIVADEIENDKNFRKYFGLS